MNEIDFKAEDFKNRITLYGVKITRDSELNCIETLVPIRTVWANVEIKRNNDKETGTGTRPEIRYQITIRYARDLNVAEIQKIGYKEKTLNVDAPVYSVDNHYIVIEAVGIYGSVEK